MSDTISDKYGQPQQTRVIDIVREQSGFYAQDIAVLITRIKIKSLLG